MHSIPSALALPVTLAALVLPAAAQGAKVWVVAQEGGVGVDFTKVHEAVEAAQSGDVVLVRPGFYGGFLLDGKGIDIVADSGGEVYVGFGDGIAHEVTVKNLPAGESVTLRGLTYFSPPVTVFGAFTVQDSAGPVWIEDCHVQAGPAVRAVDSASVALVRCTLQGMISGGEPGTEGPPRTAVEVVRSNVWIHGGSAQGAPGYTLLHAFLGYFGHAGAPAVTVADGVLGVTAGELAGGDGGAGIPDLASGGCHHPPTDGAPAILSPDASSLVHVFGAALSGGDAGAPAPGCPPASAAPPVESAGTTVLLPGQPLELAVSSPVREGEMLQAALAGVPGDIALLGAAPAQQGQLLPVFAGALLLEPPFPLLVLGPLPAGGELVLQAQLPELGPGVQGLAAYLQGASCNAASGTCTLGMAGAVVLLDAAF